MNLVLSGPIDDTLRNLVVALSKPRRVVPLHGKADRLEGVDDHDAVRRQVAALCEKARVDHAYVEEGVRFSDFKLLAMDMDSTLITIECIDEIADFAGKKAEVAAITESAMRGEIEFEESLRLRVGMLAGASHDVLHRVNIDRLRLTEGATEITTAAKALGTYMLLLSGGFTYFAQSVKELLGIDEMHANILELKDFRLTGRLYGTIIDQYVKASLVRERMNFLRCDSSQVLVIGDGANDILMMRESSYSVSFHGKPKTRLGAQFSIRYGSLTTVLDYFPNEPH